MLAIGSAPPRKHVGTPPTSAVLRGSVCRPDDGHSHSTAARTAEKQSHLHGRFQMINSNRTVCFAEDTGGRQRVARNRMAVAVKAAPLESAWRVHT